MFLDEKNASLELTDAHKIMLSLAREGIETVLFGSLAASVYLGKFKEFGDIDLLVESMWLNQKWGEFQNILTRLGYQLTDEKEHEFQHKDGETVAFAGLDVFKRDGIAFDPEEDIVEVAAGEDTLRTFSPELLKRAYEYSVSDGYRTEARGKKDQLVIDLLNDYIKSKE